MASAPFPKPAESYGSKSVQELAKDPMLVDVPPQYLQAQEPALLSHATSIPVVDMNSLLHGQSKDFELQQLDSICKQWGIFQVQFSSLYILVLQFVLPLRHYHTF